MRIYFQNGRACHCLCHPMNKLVFSHYKLLNDYKQSEINFVREKKAFDNKVRYYKSSINEVINRDEVREDLIIFIKNMQFNQFRLQKYFFFIIKSLRTLINIYI